jgi:hypothetical protein
MTSLMIMAPEEGDALVTDNAEISEVITGDNVEINRMAITDSAANGIFPEILMRKGTLQCII